jgi:UDP-glucose 4-epimerase
VSDPAAPFAGATCLVTGGLGFIGSNLVHELRRVGADVIVVDALVPTHGGDRRNLDGLDHLGGPDGRGEVDVIVARIDDTEQVGGAVERSQYVFNLAGQVSHLASMDDPIADLDLNARSHFGLLELIRRRRPDAVIVHTSTRQVYGRPRYLPVDEGHPTQPLDVNGIAKLAGEQAHLLYARVHDLRASSLRLTNVYGPRQSLRHSDLGFLPVFVRRAMAGEPIELYGDGRQFRDCLHVDDVVAGILLTAADPDAAGEVFNLGHPDAITLHEIATTLIGVAGAGSELRLVPWPEAHERIDIGSFQGDFSKASRQLGWRPTIDFATGARRTVDFYRDHEWYRSST